LGLHAPEPRTDREYLVEIYGALLRLGDRLDNLPCQAEAARLAIIERWQWRATGGLSVLAFTLGIVGAIIVNHLFHLVP